MVIFLVIVGVWSVSVNCCVGKSGIEFKVR